MNRAVWRAVAAILGLAAAVAGTALGEPVKVELRNTPSGGWQLLRGAEPYFVRGAGGTASLAALKSAGANSVRTWGGDVSAILDEAHSLGLTVTVGIWLAHERHGFDYSDPEQVGRQLERVRERVLKYRDHPALLMWGVGNEAEGFADTTHPRVWHAVNEAAALVKSLDPNHPTMTVTAFVHGDRIEWVHNRMPAVDIHGINAYGGAVVVPERLRAGGASKPFVLTEFGPPGSWEVATTPWGAPLEGTSDEKAAFYRRAYEAAVGGMPELALGAYAFLWGHKMEGTDTWLGMFLEDGSRLAAVDVMTGIWGGEVPTDLTPTIGPLEVKGGASKPRDPGDIVEVTAQVSDPEGSGLRVRWVLRRESGEYATGGDYRPTPPAIEAAVLEGDAKGARIRLPEAPGPYRLFLYAYDDAGGAATANVPLLVAGEPRTAMPFPVYEDGFDGMPWVPSGWMGGTQYLTVDGDHRDQRHSGQASIRIRYEGVYGWAGVAWQHPANNWGDMAGGIDIEGARALEFWARGEYGGEKVSFGVGLLGDDKPHPDSSITRLEDIVLGPQWKQYRIPLRRKDLSSIKTGFWLSMAGRQTSVTVYLDDIRFVR